MSRDHLPPKKGRPKGSETFTSWRTFFQETTTPVYVLGKGRRLRFANAAWEKLTGLKLADALGMVCSARRGGSSPASRRLLGQLRHAANSSAPVWLVGEPGSGKETAARVIHHAGPRRNSGFVGLDCAGLQPYLVESLLFGHGGVLGAPVGTLYLKDPVTLPRAFH